MPYDAFGILRFQQRIADSRSRSGVMSRAAWLFSENTSTHTHRRATASTLARMTRVCSPEMVLPALEPAPVWAPTASVSARTPVRAAPSVVRRGRPCGRRPQRLPQRRKRAGLALGQGPEPGQTTSLVAPTTPRAVPTSPAAVRPEEAVPPAHVPTPGPAGSPAKVRAAGPSLGASGAEPPAGAAAAPSPPAVAAPGAKTPEAAAVPATAPPSPPPGRGHAAESGRAAVANPAPSEPAPGSERPRRRGHPD
jgi:hypothetical protein